ncbi:MAG TPA: glycosyl transferase [Flavobacteriales bacterium]|nr:glycosyl transferase [Flavobacteriales bacterium]|tara:strand:+ start:48076 stop:48666 length:591 start_codon:yes stop_codon:yes gene_type:complete
MLKRLFDIFFSLIGIILLLPLFLIISLLIIIDSKGGIFYIQQRIGKNGKPFGLYKFRTMHTNADKKGLLTVGGRDPRVTKVGYWLRKYKLDELPQLFNVLKGDMSIVGPRPEVKKYTDLYTEEQRRVLSVKPGITDYASIEYVDENDVLARAENPEETYIKEIMPHKLELNKKYIQNQGLGTDIKIILLTIKKIIR